MATKKIKEQPVILITNDDDITSPGIKALVDAVKHLGRVVVVAPDKPQSGMGHAITIGSPLRMRKVDMFEGIESYTTSGTPVDCVKLAVDKILHAKPTICLSGINHGANHSINVIYSGTMSAAMEASIEGIPSIGFSMMAYNYDVDLSASKIIVEKIVTEILSKKQPKHLLLNVNIPEGSIDKIKGIKLCHQAYAKYEEEFLERIDPHKKNYYWLTGAFTNFDKSKQSDVWALENGYVSVVPVQFDLTNYTLKAQLAKSKLFS